MRTSLRQVLPRHPRLIVIFYRVHARFAATNKTDTGCSSSSDRQLSWAAQIRAPFSGVAVARRSNISALRVTSRAAH
jgi:hypothetical protein